MVWDQAGASLRGTPSGGPKMTWCRGGARPPPDHVPLRYGSVPFTKNPEKYIKYRVEQVGHMIDRLFDTSA